MLFDATGPMPPCASAAHYLGQLPLWSQDAAPAADDGPGSTDDLRQPTVASEHTGVPLGRPATQQATSSLIAAEQDELDRTTSPPTRIVFGLEPWHVADTFIEGSASWLQGIAAFQGPK
jgi:hypothetical protein